MNETINFKGKKLVFSVKGEGKAIVLLHGYLESKETFEDFSNKLCKSFKVVTIDLPGHGESDTHAEIHTMELMAESVYEVIKLLNLDKVLLIGHSMGGYVTMAFLELFPHQLSGFSLLHSNPFADNDEKKQNRDRQIQLFKTGRADIVIREHVPKTFAVENVNTLKSEIENGIDIARKTSVNGIISILNGMKARKDRSEILKNTSIPFLFIHGLKDNFIPENILEFMQIPENSKVVLLEQSGHMGFIEEPEKCLEAIIGFYK